MSLPDLGVLTSLLHHLSAYGECYGVELDRDAWQWLPLLTDAGWIQGLDAGVYAAAAAYMALSDDLSESQRVRKVCFALSEYRRYLIAILAEGLVQAGRLEGYHHRLEEWALGSLSHMAGEINALLDELEAGQGRLIDWQADRVLTRFAEWHAGHGSFADWDRSLLGVSGTPGQLFSAVVDRADAFVLSRVAGAPCDEPVALLPDFDLSRDPSGRLALPGPAPWSTARRLIHSSLPFFDAQGKPLYDVAQPEAVVWQDVLAQQPYYRAMLRVAIAVRWSSYGRQAISISVPGDLGRSSVLVENRTRGGLVDLLPDLVARMSCRVLSTPSASRLKQVLEHWIEVGALESRDGQVLLCEPYARTLHERRRARMLLRGSAWDEQERVEAFLKGSQ